MAMVIAHIRRAEILVPGTTIWEINFAYWVTMAWRIVSQVMV